MGSKHISELLIEANKKISQLITEIEDNKSSIVDNQACINDINSIIRQLDHIVEELEKNK
jgi:hypothetical protein